MGRKVYDISKKGDGWAVKGRDNERASIITNTKTEAINAAAQIGRNNGNAQVVIHKRNGQIQSERTYGNDPYPPKG